MPDDKTTKGPRDATRVNIQEDYEIRYWTKKFNLTPDELRAAVEQAGPMVVDIKKYLNRKKS